MREDIKEFDEKVLKDNQDLTVYLVKKAFLEGKTIKEINDDLDTDLNPVFQKEDKNYIGSSTLKALGIQLPKTEYLTSLRYTRDGYSDAMGEKMRARWINLSAQEKEEFKNSIKEGKADKEASLTEEEKIERQQTRSEAQKQRWAKMTPEEKTEQIQSLMNGSKKQRIIMINAWNNSPEIRDALSREMTAFHITNPISKIYKTNNHSKEMSKVMTEFWKKNANFADKIGDEIALSMEAFENAKKAGKEEEFIDATLKKQKEIFEILQKEKEKELTTYAAMTIACVRQLYPLYPFNAAAEFGIFQAKPAYAGTKADIAKFEKEHPTMETEARYARFKGLLDCASDDTREILANRGIKIKELDELCKQAEAGKKEVTITPEGGKSYTIKFDKAPSQDDIDKYFIEYQTPLNDEEKSKIAKEIEKKLKEDSMHSVFNVAGIKNSINKFGGVSREILHGDEKMKSLLLNAITNDFLEGEICKKYKAAQKAGKESQFRAMMDKVLAETV